MRHLTERLGPEEHDTRESYRKSHSVRESPGRIEERAVAIGHDREPAEICMETLLEVRQLIERARVTERANRELHLKCLSADQNYETWEERLNIAEKSRDEAQSLVAAMREAIEWFCWRVETGEIRSGRTYRRFRDLLDGDQGAAPAIRERNGTAIHTP